MKKQDTLRTVKLICFILLALVSGRFVLFNTELYHSIGSDERLRIMAVLVWLNLLLTFVFLLLEYTFSSAARKEYREMVYAAHTDSLSGLANRFGADSILDEYLDKPIPKDFCCIMLELSNLYEVNELKGRLAGNALIKDFSYILTGIAGDWYVARNGGNKFIALLNPATETEIHSFQDRLEKAVATHNGGQNNSVVRYRCGIAFHEPQAEQYRDVTALIALANNRIEESGHDT